ncbi:hypothetical protein GTA51_19500 [Desulfovibrio aerotolerans]|uniref:Uncharacterized protein n=1 Tax=Solidesulfovibrio aerotolerans TaxID=295255 RepID=A0A7C9IP27_9BACT|nr:hypothetical protein [Solidesulfovibrio aerotolerans]MYL85284.1 hypothetical protein [Solidesulfovibrio aerotolerans]
MKWSYFRTWFHGMLQPVFRSSSGATMLWVIAAITILGGFAAAVNSITPSSMQGKLAGERGSRAYYAALSGVEYFKALQDSDRETFKAKNNAGRTIGFGEDSFFITNIASDSDSWSLLSG